MLHMDSLAAFYLSFFSKSCDVFDVSQIVFSQVFTMIADRPQVLMDLRMEGLGRRF